MRVYDQNLTGTSASESARSQDTQKTDRSTAGSSWSAASSSGDRVELSSGLASVSRALSTDSSDRAGKIQGLTAQYQSGTYAPNSLAVSQAMVGEALGGAR